MSSSAATSNLRRFIFGFGPYVVYQRSIGQGLLRAVASGGDVKRTTLYTRVIWFLPTPGAIEKIRTLESGEDIVSGTSTTKGVRSAPADRSKGSQDS